MVLIHRGFAWARVRSKTPKSIAAGVERKLFRDGQFNEQEMSAALVTSRDIAEAVRQQVATHDLGKVRSASLERNGEITLIRKKSGVADE
jgi:uncharacterized membrane protein YcaP (DUF421 family)